jgi:hypothetical protein
MICLDTIIVLGIVNGRNATGSPRAIGASVTNTCSNDFSASASRSFHSMHAGDIRAVLERQGMPIGPYDCLIAAQARCRGATLVTANGREFDRVPGLLVADWTA